MNRILTAFSRNTNADSTTGTRFDLVLPRGWPENGASVAWHLRTPAALNSGEVADLREIADGAASARVHVWTPTAETVLTHATLPTRSRQKIAQALPYALEEQVLDDPANLQFAYTRENDGRLAVAITARARLKAWHDTLTGAGLKPVSLSPTVLALPLAQESWSLAFCPGEILVRDGRASGFACPISTENPPAQLAIALRQAVREQRGPMNLIVFQAPAGFDPLNWSTALNLPVHLEHQFLWQAERENQPSLNLLQGEYAPTGRLSDSTLPLRPAAVMLGVWLVGSLVFDLWEWWDLRRQHLDYRQEMTRIFIQTFPKESPYDPIKQMQRHLDTLQARDGVAGAHDFLPLLGNVAPVMRAQGKAKLHGMKYNDHSLTMDLSLPDLQTLETLKASLKTSGLRVEVLSANSQAGRVEGRLRLLPATAQKVSPAKS
jgi:general secretion pathway protein L